MSTNSCRIAATEVRSYLHVLMLTSLATVAAALSLPALAAEPAPAAAAKPAAAKPAAAAAESDEEVLGEVIITGSLIRGIAPVGSNVVGISRQDIESSGATDSNQLLGTMPQSNFFMAFPAPGGGAAALGRIGANPPNLRNLPQGQTNGNVTTLVLVDGHRVVPVGIEGEIVDAGIVPSGILERVETILDGASAVYGSDAAGGVINYITRKRFDETSAAVQYGFADNYHTLNADFTTGKSWDGGGIGLTLSYADNKALANSDRDYTLTRDYTQAGYPFTGASCEDHVTISGGAAFAGRTFKSSGGAPVLAAPSDLCAVNAFTNAIQPQKRYSAFLTFTHDISDNIKFDMSGLYSDRTINIAFAPQSANMTVRGVAGANPVTQPKNAYFQSLAGFGIADTNNQTVVLDFGPVLGVRQGSSITNMWQVSPRLTFTFGKWQLRTSAAYGKSDLTTTLATVDTNLQNLIISGANTGSAATSVNPYNVAASPALVLAQIHAMEYPAISQGKHTLTQFNATVDGPLFNIPGGEVKAAFGAEYTKTTIDQRKTFAVTHALLPAISAVTAPRGVFGELNFPVVSAKNAMTGVQALTFALSLRYDDYQEVGKTTNPKISVSYDPVSALTLRANWGKSFRAPTVGDKVNALANTALCVGVDTSEAGCLPNTIVPYTPLPPGSPTPPTGTIEFAISGANANLQPETSKNWAVGFDFRVPWVKGLTISPTYYRIDYNNRIDIPTMNANGGPELIYVGAPSLLTLNPTPAQQDAFAALAPTTGPQLLAFVRAAANPNGGTGYTIAYLLDGRTANLGGLTNTGMDLNVRYQRPVSWGSIDANINGTWRLKSSSQFFVTSTPVDQLATGVSRSRMTAQFGLTHQAFRAQATILHSAGYGVTSTGRDPTQTHIDSDDLVNLAFRYNVSRNSPLLQDMALSLNIQNVFNAEPPISRTTVGGPTNGATQGRFFQFGISKKF